MEHSNKSYDWNTQIRVGVGHQAAEYVCWKCLAIVLVIVFTFLIKGYLAGSLSWQFILQSMSCCISGNRKTQEKCFFKLLGMDGLVSELDIVILKNFLKLQTYFLCFSVTAFSGNNFEMICYIIIFEL